MRTPDWPIIAVVLVFGAVAGYGVRSGAPPADKTEKHPSAEGRATSSPLADLADGCAGASVIIALVPDPSDPPLAFTFDREVEAIMAAAQNAAHVFDGSDLPWPRVGEKAGEGRRLGALRFRADDNAKARRENLTILLVPETPTTGVDQDALVEALECGVRAGGEAVGQRTSEASEDRGSTRSRKPPKAAPHEVHLLGPTYSGSAKSLTRGLEEFVREHRSSLSAHVISGSATSVSVAKALNLHEAISVEPPRRVSGTSTTAELTVRYAATVLSDDVLHEAIERFLEEAGAKVEEIAFLVEADSTYGQGAIGRSTEKHLVMPFPMNISAIRESHEHLEASTKAAGDTSALMGIPRDRLELNLDTGEPTHRPTAYSPASVISADQILDAIVNEVHRSRFKYIGIIATEPADKIFLAKRIRRYNPDLIVVFFESDILYAHPELDQALYGSLVVSTYPLFIRNQLWSYPHKGGQLRIQFASDAAEGAYNATLLSLREIEGSSHDDRFDDLLECSLPCDGGSETADCRPPAWITGIGHGYIAPLSARTSARASESAACPEGQGENVASGEAHLAPPLVAWLLLLLLCPVVALHGIGAVCSSGRPKVSPWIAQATEGWWFRHMFDDADSRDPESKDPGTKHIRAEDMRRLSAFGICVLVILALEIALLFRWLVAYPHLAGLPGEPGIWVMRIALVVLSASAIAACVLGAWSLAMRHKESTDLSAGIALAIAGSAAALVFAPYQGSWDRMFFAMRVSDFALRLSPALPAVLLGVVGYMWCYFQLRRARLNARVAAAGESLLAKADHELAVCKEVLHTHSWKLSGFYGAAIVIFWFGYVVFERASLPFDGTGFNFVFVVLLVWFCATVVVLEIRLIMYWVAVHRLLIRLGGTRLADAFRRIPKRFWSDLGRRVFPVAHQKPDVIPEYEALLEKQWAIAHAGEGGFDRTAVGTLVAEYWASWPESAEAEALGEALHDAEAEKDETAEVLHRLAPKGQAPRVLWLRLAEDYLAARYARLIELLLAQGRGMLAYSTGAVLLLILTVSAYPFEPQRFMTLFLALALGTTVVSALVLFVQINRDEVISRIVGTEPGTISWNWDFISQLLIFTILPVLGFLATELPEISGPLSQVFGQLLRLAK